MNKVFGIGLSKTGTTSLAKALNLIGIGTVHYPWDSQTLLELRAGKFSLSLLDSHQGLADLPAATYFEEFDQLYSDSKFILTLRNCDEWVKSCKSDWLSRVPAWIAKQPEHRAREFKAFTEFIWTATYGIPTFNESRFRYVHARHADNVKEWFKSRIGADLLIMNICEGDGWEKLCPFLGIQGIPKTPFPHANSSAPIVVINRPKPILFFDLDGTIRLSHKELGFWPTKESDMKVFDGVPELLAQYKQAGCRIVGITNQSGIALGTVTQEMCVSMLRETNRLCGYAFDQLRFCPHHPTANDPTQRDCFCRKPGTQLLFESIAAMMKEHPEEIYNTRQSLFVGDMESDEACARNAGIAFMSAKDWRAATPAEVMESLT